MCSLDALPLRSVRRRAADAVALFPCTSLLRSDFLKAYQYVNTVKQFRDDAVVRQVRGEVMNKKWLEPFECTQLINLCPQDPQEAKALIPSLVMEGREIDNAQLNEVLDQLNSFKQFSSM